VYKLYCLTIYIVLRTGPADFQDISYLVLLVHFSRVLFCDTLFRLRFRSANAAAVLPVLFCKFQYLADVFRSFLCVKRVVYS